MIPRRTDPGVDEARLIADVRAGNAEAFEHFVRKYQSKIKRRRLVVYSHQAPGDASSDEAAGPWDVTPGGVRPVVGRDEAVDLRREAGGWGLPGPQHDADPESRHRGQSASK